MLCWTIVYYAMLYLMLGGGQKALCIYRLSKLQYMHTSMSISIYLSIALSLSLSIYIYICIDVCIHTYQYPSVCGSRSRGEGAVSSCILDC